MGLSKQSGLTLIELLLAIGILAIITVGCYTVTDQFVTSDKQLRGRLQQLQALQRSVQIIGRDLGQVFPRSVQSFQDRKPAMLGSRETIEFTRGGYLVPDFVNRPSSELARIRYYLNADRQLMRAVWRILDRPNQEPDGEAVVLRGVEGLEWSYIPPVTLQADVANRDGVSQWPVQGSQQQVGNRLPWGVALSIETAEWGELRWLWEMPNFQGVSNNSNQGDGSNGNGSDGDGVSGDNLDESQLGDGNGADLDAQPPGENE